MAKKTEAGPEPTEALAPAASTLTKEQEDELAHRPANYEPPRDMIVPRVKVHRTFRVFWDADAPLKLNDACALKPGKHNALSEDEFRRLRNQVKHVVELPEGLIPGPTIWLASNRVPSV
jgi:hypothetical protein